MKEKKMQTNLKTTTILPTPEELNEFYKNNPTPEDITERIPYFSELANRVIEHSEEMKKFVCNVVEEHGEGATLDELSDEDIEELINEVYKDEE
jgi:lipoate-protein ligase A